MLRRLFSVLPALRGRMKEMGLHAVYVPKADPHQLRFLTGFTGSSGHAVVTESDAVLWTDSRYQLQAESEVQAPWRVVCSGSKGAVKYQDWLPTAVPRGAKVGFDDTLTSADEVVKRQKDFADSGIHLTPIGGKLINELWTERPPLEHGKVIRHETEFAGLSTLEKSALVCKDLRQRYLLTADLMEIAWLLNLRGSDIPYNPFFYAYLVLEKTEKGDCCIYLFSDHCESIRSLLPDATSIVLKGYGDIESWLASVKEEVACDLAQVSYSLYRQIAKPKQVQAIISKLKAVKTRVELEGFRNAHVRDAEAFMRFWCWLSSALSHSPVTEESAAAHIDYLRSLQPLFHSPSFATISASGAHAAIVHYAAASHSPILPSAIYLIDSGGHYHDGTTDITRTLHFSVPSSEEKRAYTRVLQGHLALQQTVWPADANVSGSDLDAIARYRLWQDGLDYRHGTGHGVGHFSCVHEGPCGIAKSRSAQLEAGMVITNEPGYYKAGAFGIRIENVMAVQRHLGIDGYLRFERMTVVPYDRRLIEKSMLTGEETTYIDQYHTAVRTLLAPRVLDDSAVSAFLQAATEPL